MDFDLSESQLMLQDTLGRYFERDFDLTRVRRVFEGDDGLADDLWAQLGAMGLLGLLVPEDHGGSGMELLDAAAAAESLGHAAAPGPFLEHVLATLAITLGGSPDQQARWLPGLATGALRGTVALADPEGRWSAPAPTTSQGRLAGSTEFVLYPHGADVVAAATSSGLTIVEPQDAMRITDVEGIDRTRRLAHVEFDRLACQPLTGGLDLAQRVVDAGVVLLAADAFGAGRRCLELAVDYAKAREQFGVTIGHFQAVKHQLADVAVDLLPAQGLYWYAAHAFDHVVEDASRAAALAKAHTTERAVQAGRRAVELHGGIGYTWECDLHFFLKRAIFDRAYLGAPKQLRARVAELNGWPTPVSR